MAQINEIIDSKSQSFGNNSFTTEVSNDEVKFDSAQDKFKFSDDVYFDGKIYRKKADKVYNEIHSFDFLSSYTSGEQIATYTIDGKSKGLFIRPTVKLDTSGDIGINNILFKVVNGELKVSFDDGDSYHKIQLAD